jgi:phosphatidylglycerol lysyltransferase
MGIRRKLLRLARGLLPFVLLVVAVWVLEREFRALSLSDIARAIREVAPERVALSAAVAGLCYWVLSFYDVLALVHLRKWVRYERVLLTAFIASAFGHSIGVSFLSAGSVRYRMYASWGLSGVEVLRVIVFCALTFWVGFAFTAGTIGVAASSWARLPFHLPPALLRAAGALCLALGAGYFYLSIRARPLAVGRFSLSAPRLPIALGQVVVGALEWLLMTSVLYLLLPPGELPYVRLLGLFLLSHMAGLISHVPGGLGVFEWVLVSSLDGAYSAHTVLGAIVLYRVVYYFGPFVVAVVLFGASEVARRRLQLTRLGGRLLGRGSRAGGD